MDLAPKKVHFIPAAQKLPALVKHFLRDEIFPGLSQVNTNSSAEFMRNLEMKSESFTYQKCIKRNMSLSM